MSGAGSSNRRRLPIAASLALENGPGEIAMAAAVRQLKHPVEHVGLEQFTCRVLWDQLEAALPPPRPLRAHGDGYRTRPPHPAVRQRPAPHEHYRLPRVCRLGNPDSRRGQLPPGRNGHEAAARIGRDLGHRSAARPHGGGKAAGPPRIARGSLPGRWCYRPTSKTGSNPAGATFAPARGRAQRTKGAGSRKGGLAGEGGSIFDGSERAYYRFRRVGFDFAADFGLPVLPLGAGSEDTGWTILAFALTGCGAM
jgi:hypothetical protein